MIELKEFALLKRLRVCDIVVQPKRISANYEITHRDGTIVRNVLFYTYGIPLFDSHSATDLNLASVMVAQVAINYGLFCEELVFDGHFDKTDQDFIKTVVENTSREIVTNKLLSPNPFLISPYDQLNPKINFPCTQAQIVFPNAPIKLAGPDKEAAGQSTDINKYAILSSGGKDSLLSYGLLKEFGEPHPVFVNEAGRHWFTAVNAYRHFAQHEENTQRVWCNSDRIFNWMLKNLAFIKKNYSTIRADIYPIRLWTVAVFLFGVLPVALKKGLGNIIIGNEYDTTERKSLQGISHYNALYDQSKYFDNALTRYYRRKGWSLWQYSLLRSMSELLIMKVLLKRYPDLQQHQISCHAAHEKDGRMYPCGNCEKCRRIVGMISALGADPRQCGYLPEQIAQGLARLGGASIKQIGSDAAHLYHMLVTNRLISENAFTKKIARAHPRVMQLRFDDERSNLEDLPQHVREPLFNILSQYSDGAVIKKNQNWESLELTSTFLNSKAYKYHV